MNVLLIILIALAAVAAVAGFTGRWRIVLKPFCINPDKMTVDRLGLRVADGANTDRVDTVLRSFAGGFNAMLTSPTPTGWEDYCNSLPVLYQPFGHEGAAMGFVPARLFRYDPADFENHIVKHYPGMRYLYYVGLGFWSGMRDHSPARLARIAAALDPLHKYLCYDGYGFKRAFFDYPTNAQAFDRLNELDGYARSAAYQGVGRAFYFLFMDDPDTLVEHISKLGRHAPDAAAGLGLASVFVNPDQLAKAQELAERIPAEWRAQFHLGMCFALKARSINNNEQFDRDLGNVPGPTRDAAYASIRECDRVELQIRSEEGHDSYRRWRERVAQWMTQNIEYPLAGVNTNLRRDTSNPARQDATV